MDKARRLRPEDSRQAALAAAREILIDAGPRAVTLKAVGARIGRTHANLLHHFGSAAGLQQALAAHLAETICATIEAQVLRARQEPSRAEVSGIVDLTFDAFDREGAGALASWMLLSGDERALDPVIEAIHGLVDRLDQGGADRGVHDHTLALVLMALGDALMGAPLAAALGLPRSRAREIAADILARSLHQGTPE